jgi:hypothetical protein
MYTKAILNGGLPAEAAAPAAAPNARTAGADARNGNATAVPQSSEKGSSRLMLKKAHSNGALDG